MKVVFLRQDRLPFKGDWGKGGMPLTETLNTSMSLQGAFFSSPLSPFLCNIHIPYTMNSLPPHPLPPVIITTQSLNRFHIVLFILLLFSPRADG